MTKEQNQNEIINQAAELLELMDKLDKQKTSLYLHKLNMKRRQLKISIAMYRTFTQVNNVANKKKNLINNNYSWLAR